MKDSRAGKQGLEVFLPEGVSEISRRAWVKCEKCSHYYLAGLKEFHYRCHNGDQLESASGTPDYVR